MGSTPNHISFWTHATTDPELNVEFNSDWSCLYNLESRSRFVGEGVNGISMVNTGNPQRTGDCDGSEPGAGIDIINGRAGAVVLALNTLERQNISVAWTGRTIAPNSRIYRIRLQYRVGNGGGNPNIDWQDFATPVEYERQANAGDFQSIAPTVLPASCENQALVQLRWIYYFVSGTSNRAHLGIDDISVTSISTVVTDPTLVVTPLSLSTFTQTLGNPSGIQSFTVSGFELTNDVSIISPVNFEVSLNQTNGFSNSLSLPISAGNLASTTIYVRLNSTTTGNFTDEIVVSTIGAENQLVDVNGTCSEAIEVPVLFINEIMSSNTSTITDENGEYDDWIEIYNPNSTAVNVAGYYITDDFSNQTKYQIPTSSNIAIVPPNGYLIIWADNQTEQGALHTNFGLSSNGEKVGLYTPDLAVVDTVSFGVIPADQSYGRQSDGHPNWIIFTSPTFSASNGFVSVNYTVQNNFNIYPNPVENILTISQEKLQVNSVLKIMDLQGRSVMELPLNQLLEEIHLESLNAGLYALAISSYNDFYQTTFVKK
jgi:hypothetical protein